MWKFRGRELLVTRAGLMGRKSSVSTASRAAVFPEVVAARMRVITLQQRCADCGHFRLPTQISRIFSDPRLTTDILADENLRTRTDAVPVP